MLKSNDRWSKKKRGEGEEKKKRKKKENSLSAARFTFVTCFHICHVYVLAPLLERKIALYPSNEGKMIEHRDRELLRGFILERRRNNGEIVKERERSKEEEGRRKARRAKINKLKKKKRGKEKRNCPRRSKVPKFNFPLLLRNDDFFQFIPFPSKYT